MQATCVDMRGLECDRKFYETAEWCPRALFGEIYLDRRDKRTVGVRIRSWIISRGRPPVLPSRSRKDAALHSKARALWQYLELLKPQ